MLSCFFYEIGFLRTPVCVVRGSVLYGGMAGCLKTVTVFVQHTLRLTASIRPDRQRDCDLVASLAFFQHSQRISKSL